MSSRSATSRARYPSTYTRTTGIRYIMGNCMTTARTSSAPNSSRKSKCSESGPEVTFSGDAAREVGAAGDDWLSTDPGQLMGLFVGERCAERCNPDVTPAASEGDGDRIHRALHDHWDGADRELVVEGAEELCSLVKQWGVAGVE